MSVDTKVLLKGKVEPEAILNYIRETFDANATMSSVNRTVYHDFDKHTQAKYDDEIQYSLYTMIYFTVNGEKRMMSYQYCNWNSYENLDYYTDLGLEDMVKSETTYLSLGMWGESINILTNIVKAFGGWIDYNDCDDEPYIYFEKGADVPTKVRHVTMEEVYKAFGEIVVIDR